MRPKVVRPVTQAFLDGLSWIVAVGLAGYLRFEFDAERVLNENFLLLGLAAGAIQVLGSGQIGLYRQQFTRASFDEFLALSSSSFLTVFLVAVTLLFVGPQLDIPRSVPLIAGPIFLLIGSIPRVVMRVRARVLHKKNADSESVLIYGGGRMAAHLIPQLSENVDSKFSPKGILDDDKAKRGRVIGGIRVLDGFSKFEQIAARTGATSLIVAIPRADSTLLQKVRDRASKIDVRVLVIPSFSELLGLESKHLELHELGIEDLIGRRAVRIDSEAVRAYIAGATILVTGAGGSIGLELCRQVARHSPARLVVLDRDETALQQVQLAIEGNGLLDSPNVVLADIRDKEKIMDVFSHIRPDVVFHAAALKHLPTLERFPEEAWKSNVEGSLNVLEAADAVGVKLFVNISTDKAADPTSVLGLSKWIAESLTSWFAKLSGRNFLSVRFGNVLGSRGSLVPTLANLINHGGPITITDAEATRYFMTIEEACQLVLQAGAGASGKATLVLDMGEPVKIMDIANRMIEMAGRPIEIQFSGLRPGEKLHENLWSLNEDLQPSDHELIFRIKPQPLNPKDLPGLRPRFFSGQKQPGHIELRK